MSESEKSGTPPAASADLPVTAPAPAVTAPAKPAASETAGAFGSFGANRGSGLARGKRPTVAAAAPSASAVPAGYKPSSVSVITSQSEYKNPFTGETSVTVPPRQRANSARSPAAVRFRRQGGICPGSGQLADPRVVGVTRCRLPIQRPGSNRARGEARAQNSAAGRSPPHFGALGINASDGGSGDLPRGCAATG